MSEENKTLRELIRDGLDELRNDIVDIAKDIISIKSTLGCNEFGQNGVVQNQKDHEKRIKALERFNWRLAGFFSGVTIIITLIIKFL
jgi:uncharacterized membrane protein YukC